MTCKFEPNFFRPTDGFLTVDTPSKAPVALAYTCPCCGEDISGVYMDSHYFVPTDGGQTVGTPNEPSENWVEGIQTCPYCAHKWEVQDV